MVAQNVLDPGVPSAHLALADAAVVRRITVSSSRARLPRHCERKRSNLDLIPVRHNQIATSLRPTPPKCPSATKAGLLATTRVGCRSFRGCFLHDLDLVVRQTVEVVHQPVDLAVGRVYLALEDRRVVRLLARVAIARTFYLVIVSAITSSLRA